MIEHEEVHKIAEENQLTIANVQRDYIFGWLLAGIFGDSGLGEKLALKGGNALRKAHLPEARFSEDLDFTTPGAIDHDQLVLDLNEVCRLVEARTGVQFDTERNAIHGVQEIDGAKRAVKIRLYFKDFASGSDSITLKVRVDLTEFDQVLLPLQNRELIHPYSDAAECKTAIQCVKLEEALADKMKCLIQRRHCFDLFDLVYGVFLAEEVTVDRQEIVSVFLRKTIFAPSPPAARKLLEDLQFDTLRKYWNKLVAPARSLFEFDRATNLLLTGLSEMFAPFGGGTTSELAYYPSDLRNLILEGGANQKLIRMKYHGSTRIIEPYSLVFKRRKDGVAQEYFYGYQTAGNSKPGIRAFLHYDIQELTLTDDNFAPRYNINLSKAGDASMAGAFSSANRGRRRTRSKYW